MAKGKSSNQKDMMKKRILEHKEGRKNKRKSRNIPAEKLDHSNIAGGNVK